MLWQKWKLTETTFYVYKTNYIITKMPLSLAINLIHEPLGLIFNVISNVFISVLAARRTFQQSFGSWIPWNACCTEVTLSSSSQHKKHHQLTSLLSDEFLFNFWLEWLHCICHVCHLNQPRMQCLGRSASILWVISEKNIYTVCENSALYNHPSMPPSIFRSTLTSHGSQGVMEPIFG